MASIVFLLFHLERKVSQLLEYSDELLRYIVELLFSYLLGRIRGQNSNTLSTDQQHQDLLGCLFYASDGKLFGCMFDYICEKMEKDQVVEFEMFELFQMFWNFQKPDNFEFSQQKQTEILSSTKTQLIRFVTLAKVIKC